MQQREEIVNSGKLLLKIAEAFDINPSQIRQAEGNMKFKLETKSETGTDKHPLAGKKVRIKLKGKGQGQLQDGCVFRVEDWQVRMSNRPWFEMSGNPACVNYAMRAGAAMLPLDTDCVYGHVICADDQISLGYIVHISELGEVVEEA